MSNDVTSSVTPYEFNAEQSKLIGNLGGSMRIVGVMALAWAAVGIISMGIMAWKSGILFFDLNPVLGALHRSLGALWRDVLRQGRHDPGQRHRPPDGRSGQAAEHLQPDRHPDRRRHRDRLAATDLRADFHPEGASLVVGGHASSDR